MIYCVKLRQKKLPTATKLNYFPFDRFYLIPKENRELANKMFRYFFYMDVSDEIIAAISHYQYTSLRTIPAIGRPTIARGVEAELAPIWDELISGDYFLVVPTYPQRTRVKGNPNAEESPATPAYYMTQALRASDNSHVLLPQIGVHTPKRDVPLICAVCKNYSGYCENECSPGRGTCKSNIDIPITMKGKGK